MNNLNLRKLTDEHWRVLAKLREIGRTRELILIRGNHDHDWHGDRLRQEMATVLVNGHSNGFAQANGSPHEPEPLPGFRSVDVLPAVLDVEMREEYQLDIGSQSYLVTHGDRFDPALHSELPRYLAGWCYQITRKVSKKFAKWLKKRSASWSGSLSQIRQLSVIDHARQHDYAGIVIGHTHYADDINVEGVHYVNSGCWTDASQLRDHRQQPASAASCE